MFQHDGCHGKTSALNIGTSRLVTLTDNKQLTDPESRGAHPVARGGAQDEVGGGGGGNPERETATPRLTSTEETARI